MVEAGFVIARGATQPLDIATCEGPGSSPQVPQTFYSFLSLSWAIVADIDIESEAYRCCGPARFEVSTVQRILCMRRYYGRLSYLPADAAPEDAGAESTPATPAGLKRLLPAADAAVPAGWVEEEGETVLFWACNTAWASFESAQTPEAQLSDGCWHLLTISGDNPHLAFCEVLNIAEDPAALANEHPNIRAPRAPLRLPAFPVALSACCAAAQGAYRSRPFGWSRSGGAGAWACLASAVLAWGTCPSTERTGRTAAGSARCTKASRR